MESNAQGLGSIPAVRAALLAPAGIDPGGAALAPRQVQAAGALVVAEAHRPAAPAVTASVRSCDRQAMAKKVATSLRRRSCGTVIPSVPGPTAPCRQGRE